MRRLKSQVTGILICVLLMVLAIVPFAVAPRLPASAASGITLNSSVQISFPTSMTFKVKGTKRCQHREAQVALHS